MKNAVRCPVVLLLALFHCIALPAAEKNDNDRPADWFDQVKDIAAGPGKLSLDFSERVRYEHYDNFTIKGYGTDENDHLMLMRTRVGVEYRLNPPADGTAPRFYVQFQDARHWLSDLDRNDFPHTCPYFDQCDLRQAFVEWRHIGGGPLGLKAGRQSVSYADNRVFGPGNWGNVGRYWWDVVKLTLDTAPAAIDFLYGRRVISEPVSPNDRHYDFDMVGVYAQAKNLPFDLHGFYVLRHNDHGDVRGERGTGDRRTHSLGLYLDGTAGRWDYGATAVGQFGEFGGDDICAFGGNARLGYTFDAPWKPRLGAEFSYASGDGDPADGRHETFDGVFGAVDCLYGRMNMFSWKNLEDYRLSASISPLAGLKLSVDYHVLRLASDNGAWYWCNCKPMRRTPGGGAGRTVGSEIDVVARWKINAHWDLMAGYGHFFPGSYIESTGGNAGHADWVFTQVTFTF